MEQGLRSLQKQNNLEKWTKEVTACRASGLQVTQWCEENGIAPNTYFRHQRKVFEAMNREEVFYEIPEERKIGMAAVSIAVNGLRAEIQNGAEERTIRAVLRAMKEC